MKTKIGTNALHLFFLLTLFVFGCARAPIRSPNEAMRATKQAANFSFDDDLQLKDLADGLAADIARLKNINGPTDLMRFGPKTIARGQYIEELQALLVALKQDSTGQSFVETLRSHFEVFEVYGDRHWGEVFVTGYYEPVINGSLTKTKEFTSPVYGVPKDMILVNTAEFNRILSTAGGDAKNHDQPETHAIDRDGAVKLPDTNFRGRLIPAEGGRLATVVPYYSREELTAKELPEGSAPILAWIDPIDAFFLQIQGSGRIVFKNKKEIRVGYAEQNGRPYVPIGRALFDKIPKDKMSRSKIIEYLRSISDVEAMTIMNQNPSFVFFQKLTGAPLTSFGAEVVPARTIATDGKYFPKGALAYLEFQKPIFADALNDDAVTFQVARRFVLDQDTGGAIRGPGRVDVFMGAGPDAERASGVMRQKGRLYYLVPK